MEKMHLGWQFFFWLQFRHWHGQIWHSLIHVATAPFQKNWEKEMEKNGNWKNAPALALAPESFVWAGIFWLKMKGYILSKYVYERIDVFRCRKKRHL